MLGMWRDLIESYLVICLVHRPFRLRSVHQALGLALFKASSTHRGFTPLRLPPPLTNTARGTMGFWDTLCPLCGIAPSGGPRDLTYEYDLHKHIKRIAKEIRETSSIDYLGLENIIKKGMEAAMGEALPEGMGYREYSSTYIVEKYY